MPKLQLKTDLPNFTEPLTLAGYASQSIRKQFDDLRHDPYGQIRLIEEARELELNECFEQMVKDFCVENKTMWQEHENWLFREGTDNSETLAEHREKSHRQWMEIEEYKSEQGGREL